VEIKDHKADHPMVKWTLNPRIGQRQWTDLEANLALEELRTNSGDEDEDEDDDSNGEGDYDDSNGEEEDDDLDDILAAGAAVAAELGLDDDEIDISEDIGGEEDRAADVPDDNQAAEVNGDENHNDAVDTGNQDPEKPDDHTTGNQHEVEEKAKEEVGDDLKGPPDEGSVMSTATSSQFTCDRCAAPISLEATFYRCVGHSCRGASFYNNCRHRGLRVLNHSADFFICGPCESVRVDSDAGNADGHHWWHSLLVLRKSLIEPVPETPSNTKVESTQTETQTVAGDLPSSDEGPHTALASAVVTRISDVEDKFHAALAAMEGKVDSTRVALESQIGSTTTNLEERMAKLDDKMTELTKMFRDLIGRLNV
jgi:hypothetical protein